MKLLSVLLSVAGVSSLVWVCPVSAETGRLASLSDEETRREYIGNTEGSPSPLVPQSPSQSSSIDLLAQDNLTRVTGVEVIQTEEGFELVLETIAGSERLVPLIVPQGKNLVIDILDATLAFSIRNGVTELNPAPGIRRITVNKGNENSVRVRIAGANQTPSADVVPGRNDLVLSITPESTTAEQEPDEEIEVIATGQAGENDYNVDETSVGTRTDTQIQDVPQSIQVVPREVIEDQQTTRAIEALRNVPGVTTADSSRLPFTIPIIRGFGGFDDQDGLLRRNGLRDPRGTISGGDTANVERIEVLKGPASVLYGQGSPGGVVNIVTKQPSSDPFYKVEGAIGNFDLYRGTLDLSGPLNEDKNLLYRLNVAAETTESFVDFFERDRYLVNPVLAWQIGDNTNLTFDFEYRHLQYLPEFGLPAVGTVLDNPNGDIPEERFIGDVDVSGDRNVDVYRLSYNLEHQFNKNWKLRNAFSALWGRTDSVVITPRSLDTDGRTLERGYFDTGEGFKNNTYVLDTYTVGKFNTGSIEHELVTGIELARAERINDESFGGDVSPIDLFDPQYGVATLSEPTFFVDNKNTQDSLGIYLQDQVTLLDKFIVVLGGRFDILDNKDEDFSEDTDESQQNEGFSPRVGLVYKPLEALSLYASYSRSLNQSVGQSFDGDIFEPGRGTQFEIGAKGDISDRLSATLALYDLTRTNVSTTDPDNPEFEIQTGEQNSQGIELSVAGEILPGWNITTGYAYTDAKITEDNTFEEGNGIINVPENAINLWTTYEIQQGSLSGLGFGAGIFFVGEREGDLDNTFQLPSYTRTDAAIFYEKGGFRTAVNFKNLFDIDYFETADGDLNVYRAEPFTVIGSLSYKF